MNRSRGFTLIELAIVLVIVTILIGGLAVPLSTQIQARRIGETRADMRAIHDALIGYAMSHTAMVDLDGDGTAETVRHFLPCPDDGSGPQVGEEGARNSTTRQCGSTRGALPWRTLGVEDADPWGQRYTYAVTPEFADDNDGFISTPTPTASPPTNATDGTLRVHTSSTCSGAGVANKVAVVIVSHGPNGRGAQNRNGGTPLAANAVPGDEGRNLSEAVAVAGCNKDIDFVSHAPDEDFDDLVTWLSPSLLFSRVCPGGCP
jgi:prepilin-type N-terminal cleavage/methylation domain-containing protein